MTLESGCGQEAKTGYQWKVSAVLEKVLNGLGKVSYGLGEGVSWSGEDLKRTLEGVGWSWESA